MEKMKDIVQYYDRVEYCCCIADSLTSERHKILDQVVCFNTILKGQYRIGSVDEDEFVDFYKKYKVWLAEKFVDRDCLFGERYKDCFSLKERKLWKINDFKAVFAVNLQQTLFFAQTFSVFALIDLKNKDDEMLVAHKMLYGALLMLRLIGYSLDYEINNEINIIDCFLSKAECK